MKRVAIFLLATLLPGPLWSQPRKPATLAEIATYNGPDREQVLYAGAKGEGKIVWYTSLAGDSYKAIARGFEGKYPGVRLETYRAGGSELGPRIIEEAKARRPLEKFDYGSAAKNLGFKRWRPDHGIATDKYEKDLERWEKLLKEISRKGG